MKEHNPLGKKLLAHINLGPVEENGWGFFISRNYGWIKRIPLVEETNTKFAIVITTGDDMTQARQLYTKKWLSKLQATSLDGNKWKIENKFHFSNAYGKNLFTTVGAVGLSNSVYFDYWKKAFCDGLLHQYKREDWKQMLDNLVNAKMMNEKDIIEFENEIEGKKYGVINICPGMCFTKVDSFDRMATADLDLIAKEWRGDLEYLISCFS